MTRTRDYCLSIRIVEIVRSRTWSRVYSIIVNATTLFKHDRVSKLGLHLVWGEMKGKLNRCPLNTKDSCVYNQWSILFLWLLVLQICKIISASFPLQPNTKLGSVGAVHEFFNSINLIFNRIAKNVALQLQRGVMSLTQLQYALIARFDHR